jgi:hypothetical protein
MSRAAGRMPMAFLVGAPKAGSSALSNFLAQHPQLAISRPKEVNFMCDDLGLGGPRSEREYLSHFRVGPETRILLDASILYLYSQHAARRIADFDPAARILVILRNPVEAAYAWHAQMVFTANEPIRDFAAALDAERERKRGARLPPTGTAARSPGLLFYRELMCYGSQLERYLRIFPRDAVLVLSYDDFQADPERTLAEAARFLDLDPAFRPATRIVNPAKERRSWRLHFALKRAFATPARALLPDRTRRGLIRWLDRVNSREVQRTPLDASIRQQLGEAFRGDLELLSDLVGRDFTGWVQPSEADR